MKKIYLKYKRVLYVGVGSLLAITILLVVAFYNFVYVVDTNKLSPSREAYPQCVWERTTAFDVAIWGQKCDFGFRQTRVVSNKSSKSFVLEVKETNGEWQASSELIRLFDIPQGKIINAIMPQVVTEKINSSLGRACVFVKSPYTDVDKDRDMYTLELVGEAKVMYEKFGTTSMDIPEPPCGKYGIDADKISYFVVYHKHPEIALYINVGQEVPMFDEENVDILTPFQKLLLTLEKFW